MKGEIDMDRVIRREIDGIPCVVFHGRDVNSVEWDEPRLKYLNEKCKCTQHEGKIFVYTGRRVVTVAKDQPWKKTSELLKIGRVTVKKIINQYYEPNEVIF